MKEIEKLYNDALKTLQNLEAENGVYTINYFSAQWERQRKCQLDAIVNNSLRNLEDQLVNLLDLEEQLTDAQCVFFLELNLLQRLTMLHLYSAQLSRLRRKRKRHQTEAEKLEASTLPTSIVALENAIQGVAEQLGSPEFSKLKESTSKHLIHCIM